MSCKECGQELPLTGVGSEDARPSPYAFIISPIIPARKTYLVDDIQTLGFFEMKGRYVPLNTCCDRFIYEITVRRGDRVHTVVTIDAAPDAPVALWQALEKVSSLLVDLQ